MAYVTVGAGAVRKRTPIVLIIRSRDRIYHASRKRQNCRFIRLVLIQIAVQKYVIITEMCNCKLQ